MKVNDRNPLGAMADAARTQETQRADSSTKVALGRPGGGVDRVELSATAGTISRALSSGENDRAAKLSAIAADYQAGRYQPNSLATARGLISEGLAAGLP